MGCAACFGEKIIQQPIRHPKSLKIRIFQQNLKLLLPSKLIPQQQFLALTKSMNDYCSNLDQYAPKKIISQQSNTKQQLVSKVISQDEYIKSKWKLLIFCHKNVFFNESYNQFNQNFKHQCFNQIQKDLDRTFPDQKIFQTIEGIQLFKRILKRVAMYFPKVGYTQGVNFIVGYLIVQGFNQIQSFWFTVNMALNQKYLLLGLFQDGFPLSAIYCKLFKYLMKKKVPKLYQKFQKISVPDEIWIFKWFMTYYLYSFPLIIVKQIWDFVIVRGGIGLVYFGISLIMLLQKILLQFQEDSEVSNFFMGMKDLENFNHYINMNELIDLSYGISIEKKQIQDEIKIYKQSSPQENFYLNLYSNYDNQEVSNYLLREWYTKINSQRKVFEQQQRELFRKTKPLQQQNYIILNLNEGKEINVINQQFEQIKTKKILSKQLDEIDYALKIEQMKNNNNKKQQPPKEQFQDILNFKLQNLKSSKKNVKTVEQQIVTPVQDIKEQKPFSQEIKNNKFAFSADQIIKQNLKQQGLKFQQSGVDFISPIQVLQQQKTHNHNYDFDKEQKSPKKHYHYHSHKKKTLNLKNEDQSQQQQGIVIFELNQNQSSFKKKKIEQNIIIIKSPKKTKKSSQKNIAYVDKNQINQSISKLTKQISNQKNLNIINNQIKSEHPDEPVEQSISENRFGNETQSPENFSIKMESVKSIEIENKKNQQNSIEVQSMR